MSGNHRSWQLPGIVLMIALSGCASGYHAYRCGCIPYRYCPEPPLPYTTYCSSHCPTPITSQCCQHGTEIRTQHAEGPVGVAEDSVGHDGKNSVDQGPRQVEP